ncbi:hypothetical protein GGR52DRAFT_453101 [Hypoxylon sp. FL1284]|nr:hypothetical protein GGR52DRAFT_453101 [Hypoxylon sp. FL1284]
MTTRMLEEYLAAKECQPPGNVGADYLFGFDISDKFDWWYLSSLIDDGRVPEDDMKQLASLSLAIDHREFLSSDDPFEGRDRLPSVAEASSQSVQESDNELSQDESDDAVEHAHSSQSGTSEESTSESESESGKGKRKISESSQETILGQPAKKRGKEKKSPFWQELPATPHSPPSVQSAVNGERLGDAGRKDACMAGAEDKLAPASLQATNLSNGTSTADTTQAGDRKVTPSEARHNFTILKVRHS